MLLCCTLRTLLTTLPACPLHLNPQFHLEQAKQRTQQRLAAGRPKPIDRLAHGLFVLEDIDPLEVG